MKGQQYFVGLVMVLSLTAACLMSCDLVGAVGARVTITSEAGSAVQVRVFLEGSDGKVIDGALVSCRNPGSETIIMGFSAQSGSYAGAFSSLVAGEYLVRIESRLSPEPQEIVIDHKPLSAQPLITVLMDEAGNNGLTGQDLDASEEIAVAWTAPAGATVHTLQVLSGTRIVWKTSSASLSTTIPVNVLSSGSHGFLVTSQSISGDPLLQSNKYYSVSQSRGSTRYVSVVD